LNLDIDYYNRLTSDKYADLTLPSTTGFSSIRNNNGKLRNRGIELQLSGKIMETRDFTWDASLNITYNKNK
ncbi:TonB-dependent receptor, partial [Bacteroides fragilis]